MTDAPQIGDIVFVLDGDNLVHRVYHSHAVDGYTAPDGTPLNAVIGWVRSIRAFKASGWRRHVVDHAPFVTPCPWPRPEGSLSIASR